ncbi:MAG: MFS transporter, partial [Acetobacteraceae bacterium]
GVLLAIYPIGQFVGSPVIGVLSDRYGRKPVLMASLAAAVCSYAVIALGIEVRSILLIGVGCLAGGLSESNIAIVQSAVSDVAAPNERPRLFGYVYSACSVGYIAGPVVGGQIAVLAGWSTPFWIVVFLLVATAIWVRGSFAETHPAEPARKIDAFAGVRNLATVFTDRPIRGLYLVNFLFYLALFGYFRVILLYVAEQFHMSVEQSTVYYAYLAAMSLTASLLLVGPLTRRFGLRRLAIGSAVLSGLAMIVVVLPRSAIWLWFTAAPCSLIGTLTLASCAAILANSVDGDREGRVMGNNQALQVGAEGIGAVAGGAMAAILVPLPLMVFGVLLILTGLLLSALSRAAPAVSLAS